jgi:hypothetical protein
MDSALEPALRGLEDAAAFATTYRCALTPDYVALIERVEALPQNQSGADRSGRWKGSRAHARSLATRAVLLPRKA